VYSYGSPLTIVCQVKNGNWVYSITGVGSDVWDKLTDQRWVSDLYVGGTAVDEYVSQISHPPQIACS
jgi:hypothetical protein